MRHKILLLLLVLLPLSAVAQSYDKLWKQAQAATEADQPRTALGFVEQMRQKAAAEGNRAEELRAMIYACTLWGDISRDSLDAAWRRMETQFEIQSFSPSTNASMRLWASALGQSAPFSYSDTAYRSRVREYFNLSVEGEPEVAGGALAKNYKPLLTEGKASRYFDNDLLHVLVKAYLVSDKIDIKNKKAVARRAISYYKEKGNRNAALLLALDTARLDIASTGFDKTVAKIGEEYRDLPLNVETYIMRCANTSIYDSTPEKNDSLRYAIATEGVELYGKEKRANALRNVIAKLTVPAARLTDIPNVIYPEAGRQTLKLTTRNVSKVKISVMRIDVAARDLYRLHNENTSRELDKIITGKKIKSSVIVLTKPVAVGAPYAWTDDSVSLSFDQPGIYRVSLAAAGEEMGAETVNVSGVLPLTLRLPDGSCRISAVDSRSGKPITDWTISAMSSDGKQLFSKKSDKDGHVTIGPDDRDARHDLWLFAHTETDNYAPAFVQYNRYGGFQPILHQSAQAKTVVNIETFTDRAIYRPGQEVKFGTVVYSRQADDFEVMAREQLRVKLYVNNRAVDSLLLMTDSYGAAGGKLTLPEYCLPGNFRIEVEAAGRKESEWRKVEEYKRPTFTVEAEDITTAYALGDTVALKAKATTYSGVPVAGAKVKWTAGRSEWYRYGNNATIARDTAVTAADGTFTMRVPLTAPTDGKRNADWRRYSFNIQFDVTAENGETADGSYSIISSHRRLMAETQWASSVCRERTDSVKIDLMNSAYRRVEGKGKYTIISKGKQQAEGSYESGRPFMPSYASLKSGDYDAYIYLPDGTKADSLRFTLFSENDTRPASSREKLWRYVRTSQNSDSALVIVGSALRDATIFYDLMADGKVVESRRIAASDSLVRINLNYKPEYGDGASASFALVRDGRVYTFAQRIVKPEPQKQLRLSWTTFRSRLTPGQQEEWKLRVLNADGTPARASVMATLYDASLDAFAKNVWNFNGIYFNRNVYAVNWNAGWQADNLNGISGMKEYKSRNVPELSFTSFDPQLFTLARFSRMQNLYFREARVVSAGSRSKAVMAQNANTSAYIGTDAVVSVGSLATEKGAGGEAAPAMPTAEPRSDFSETAFFAPSLVSDAKGDVSISFTLPQSLTTWRFAALAHTEGMDYGRIDTTAIARKDFMVQPAMPRFVRRGDMTLIPATLTNLTDRDILTTVTMLITDAETGKIIAKQSKKLNLKAGGSSVVEFPYEVKTESPMLVCRIMAEGAGFADGEEHYLPVLADLVEVTRSIPFSMEREGSLNLRLDTLWAAGAKKEGRSLTVELTSNPTWYAVAALPPLAMQECHSAAQWAERLYATALAARIAQLNPDIEKIIAGMGADSLAKLSQWELSGAAEATPWLREAISEKQRARNLRLLFSPEFIANSETTARDNLAALQNPDGSWSWYKGMQGNAYITVNVATLLARAKRQANYSGGDAALDKAMKYLSKLIAAQVEEMKKAKGKSVKNIAPSELQLRYLYLRSLLDLGVDDDSRYLINRAEGLGQELTMYGKAVLAAIMEQSGNLDEAERQVKGLLEHTVVKPGMGRYFDTDRAQLMPSSYRMPTQTAAIEALVSLRPQGNREVEEMKLWIMQSKRTQMWQTSAATADAISALLTNASDKSLVAAPSNAEPLYFTLTKGRSIVGLNAKSEATGPAGYYKKVYTAKPAVDADAIRISKREDGAAWGSVRTTFLQPAAEVEAQGAGFALTRRLEVKAGDKWAPLAAGTVLAKGTRVRTVYTITADRDFDFVSLTSPRPACFEPVQPLSGYSWTGGMGAYRVVRDASTDFFFEHVSKGKHTFTEETFVDRAGSYTTGVPQVESVYSPEFRATSTSVSVKAE